MTALPRLAGEAAGHRFLLAGDANVFGRPRCGSRRGTVAVWAIAGAVRAAITTNAAPIVNFMLNLLPTAARGDRQAT